LRETNQQPTSPTPEGNALQIVNDSPLCIVLTINITKRKKKMNVKKLTLSMFLMIATLFSVSAFAADSHTSGPFQGPKANKGTVTHSTKDSKSILTLSDDFVVPDTPDPHWQVVDSDGNVYLLDKLKTKAFLGENFKKEIVVPKYV